MAESLDDVTRPVAGSTPEEWLGVPDPVQHFRSLLERALQELAREVAGIRAERDGLRLELEGLRAQFELVRAQLDDRERFTDTVRELHDVVRSLNIPDDWNVRPVESPVVVTSPVIELESPARQRKRRGRLKKALTRLGVVLGVLLVIAVALVSVGPKVAPYETYFVRSGSMEPTFDTGDLIVLGKVDGSDVKKGDIITFKRPDKPSTLVTHRVVAIVTSNGVKQFETKGDANPGPDAWRVPVTDKAWKYRFRIPKVGYVFGNLSTPLARVVLLAIPVVLLALLFLIDVWKPRRKDEPQPGSGRTAGPAGAAWDADATNRH